MGWAPRAPVRKIIPLQEGPKHVIRGDGTHPRNQGRRREGEGSQGQTPVGPSAESWTASAEPMAPAPPAIHLGQGAQGASAAEDQPPHRAAASELGDPASGGQERAGTGSEHGRPSACAPGAAGETAPSRPGQAGDSIENAPLSGYLTEGAGLYHRFNRFGASCVTRVPHRRLIPPVVVQLGSLVALVYRSDKWRPGRPRTYIHVMENPPRLVSDVGGRQLYLVGGSYRVTTEGIEG
jgi:hypothetical protein